MIDLDFLRLDELADSMHQITPLVRAIEEHSAPAPYTYVNIVISVVAAICGFLSYKYTKKTATSVSRLNKNLQVEQSKDLVKECLRNVVRHLVAIKRLKTRDIEKEQLDNLKYWSLEALFRVDLYNNVEWSLYKRVEKLREKMNDFNDSIETIKGGWDSFDKSRKVEALKKLCYMNIHIMVKIYDFFNIIKNKKNAKVEMLDIYRDAHNSYMNNLRGYSNSIIITKKNKTSYMKILNNLVGDQPVRDEIKDGLCEDAACFELELKIRKRKAKRHKP